MKPIPSEIVTRWSPMWAKDCCPDRPWWTARRVDGVVLTSWPPIEPFQWFRCDGLAGPTFSAHAGELVVNEAGLAAIDAAHPLPAPEPMPGQVWAWDADNASTVVDVRDGVALWNAGVHPMGLQRFVQAQIDEEDRVKRESAPKVDAPDGVFYTIMDWQRPPTAEQLNVWPPPGAVLVAGPTPWGLSIPWTPSDRAVTRAE